MIEGIKPQKYKIRIVLIEDNDPNRKLLSDYLTYCGYEVLDLPDGTSLQSAVQDFQPDVILLDLKLPAPDGYELLAKRQQEPLLRSIPVIVVSALAFQADQQRALELGAQRYFVKPVNLPQLKQAIQEEIDAAGL